ncbi:MAG: hypothetical protein WBM40_14705, partial [Thiohalocapsa sp.]
MPASAVWGEQPLQSGTAEPASPPTADGSASRAVKHGRDAAAIQLPPETLNAAIEPAELEIRLVPLTRSELAELALRWQAIVKAKSEEVVAAQIALARSDGSAEEQNRSRMAQLAEERRVLVDRFLLVLDGLEAKGAPEEVVGEYRSYVDAVIDKSIQVSDLRTVVAAIGAWFLDEDGGIALATKLLIALA